MSNQLHRLFNRARLDDRQLNELLGLSHGIIADGVVNTKEADYLQKWLVANTAVKDNPVISCLLVRINDMLADNMLDNNESQELLDTLRQFSGGDFEIGELLKSSTLPLDDPQPEITFNNASFCFTGTFAFGTRKHCEEAVLLRGGSSDALTAKTNYLVVGIYATDTWAHSSYGRKIEKAAEMRQKSVPISIISEEHWVQSLDKVSIA
jgi:NAD-dependent DNA ligase